MATVGSVGDQYALPQNTVKAKNELGKDEFMALMIAQLQNQDPTQPTDNTEMVSQMSQFSMLESVNNMTTSTMQNQAYSMIGKGVVGFTVNEDTGIKSEVMGVVESAGLSAGKSYVMVGDVKVNLSDISQVYDQNALTGVSDAITNANAMVGKFARANLGTAAAPQWLEGQVSRWQMQNGVITTTINGTDVLLGQIVTVADDAAGLGEAPAAVIVEQAEEAAAVSDEEEDE